MTEMKINMSVLKRDDLPNNEPVIVVPGEILSFKVEIDENSKDISFDILCAPSLDGVAIHGIQDSTCKDRVGILKEVK